MNRYLIAATNPEGIDWTFDFYHEKVFTKQQFQDIAEEAILYALKKEKDFSECNYASISGLEIPYLIQFMWSKGFQPQKDLTEMYIIDPHLSNENIKNKELKKLVIPIRKKLENEN